MIFGFLLAICFNPYIYAAATQPRWALLAIALPVLIALKPPSHFTILHAIGLCLIAWTALTLTWTANVSDGFGSFVQLLIVAMSFVLGARTDLRDTFKGLAIGLVASSVIVILNLKYSGIVSIGREGLFGNRNMLAEAAVLTALGCLAYRLWWYVPGLLPAIFITPFSRGAVIGLAAGLVVLYGKRAWARSRAACIAIAVLVCIAAVYGAIVRTESITERYWIYSDTLKGLTLFGNGIGSYYTLFPYLTSNWDMAEIRPDHAHNDILEMVFELGIGAIFYLALIALAYRMAAVPERTVLLAFLCVGCLSFPWHIPTTAFIAALVIGHASQRGYNLRYLNLRFRMALHPWNGRNPEVNIFPPGRLKTSGAA